jgi:hypothetical protein
MQQKELMKQHCRRRSEERWKKESQVVQIYVDFVNIMNEYFSAIKVRMRRIVCLFGVKSKFIYCTLNSTLFSSCFKHFLVIPLSLSHLHVEFSYKVQRVNMKWRREIKCCVVYAKKPQNRVYNF